MRRKIEKPNKWAKLDAAAAAYRKLRDQSMTTKKKTAKTKKKPSPELNTPLTKKTKSQRDARAEDFRQRQKAAKARGDEPPM